MLNPAVPAASTPAAVPPLERKIEIMIRSELGVPPQYQVAVGPRQKSDVNGYDTIAVTFSLPSQPEKKQMVNFLLSKDANTLAPALWELAARKAERRYGRGLTRSSVRRHTRC